MHAPLRALASLTPVLGAVLLFASACATGYTPRQVHKLLDNTVEAAWQRQQAGMPAEAAVLGHAVALVDPEFTGLAELHEAIDPEVLASMNTGWLGTNRRLRPAVERSTRTRVLLWLPDRLLDLLDVVSLDLHFGPGAFVDYHVTRGFQGAAGIRSTGGIGLHENRSFGFRARSEAGVSLVAAGAHSYAGAHMGTTGVVTGAQNHFGLYRPDDPLYHELLDYWALGASATAVFIGAEWDVHPLQLADFFAGFVGVDFLNDDLSRTRGISLDALERDLLEDLWEVRRDRSSLQDYLDARATFAPLPPTPAAEPPPEPDDGWRATDPPLPAAPADPE